MDNIDQILGVLSYGLLVLVLGSLREVLTVTDMSNLVTARSPTDSLQQVVE